MGLFSALVKFSAGVFDYCSLLAEPICSFKGLTRLISWGSLPLRPKLLPYFNENTSAGCSLHLFDVFSPCQPDDRLIRSGIYVNVFLVMIGKMLHSGMTFRYTSCHMSGVEITSEYYFVPSSNKIYISFHNVSWTADDRNDYDPLLMLRCIAANFFCCKPGRVISNRSKFWLSIMTVSPPSWLSLSDWYVM
jgi:hypothetical protein